MNTCWRCGAETPDGSIECPVCKLSPDLRNIFLAIREAIEVTKLYDDLLEKNNMIRKELEELEFLKPSEKVHPHPPIKPLHK